MRTLLVVAAIASTSTLLALGPGRAPAPSVTDDSTIDTVARSRPPSPYRPPVDAAVVDPFRAPTTPYGPGNRGLEYATVPGAPARSIGAGVVAFAGPVAGRGVVSVDHPDGLRSSLTGLVSIGVHRGDRVASGDVVGTTGAGLHLGVRRGDEYLDPAILFESASTPLHAVLVPVPG